jgi:hypothetical protein
VCVCVCVWERERDRVRKREIVCLRWGAFMRKKEREWYMKWVCVCFRKREWSCVCECVKE